MSLGDVARRRDQEVEAGRQPGGNLQAGQQPHPGGGQLDGERQPFDQLADAQDTGRVVHKREGRLDALGALREKLDRRVALEAVVVGARGILDALDG